MSELFCLMSKGLFQRRSGSIANSPDPNFSIELRSELIPQKSMGTYVSYDKNTVMTKECHLGRFKIYGSKILLNKTSLTRSYLYLLLLDLQEHPKLGNSFETLDLTEGHNCD